MNAINQIASHLKVEANQIKRCEQWAKVWFVVIQGKGARFVSKKVVKMNASESMFKIEFRKTAKARKTISWIRCGNDIESAQRAVFREYGQLAIVTSIRQLSPQEIALVKSGSTV